MLPYESDTHGFTHNIFNPVCFDRILLWLIDCTCRVGNYAILAKRVRKSVRKKKNVLIFSTLRDLK